MASFFGLTIGRVRGNSMLPRIPPDSFFVASRWHLFFPSLLPMKEGQIYYINHNRYGFIVKTLHVIDSKHTGENSCEYRNNATEECYWFRGESSESVSTDAIGAITMQDIVGRVIGVIPPTKR